MNIETLQQLAKNPHYKLTDKQKAELTSVEKKPMITFGALDKHDNDLPVHNTGEVKRKVVGKNYGKK